MGQKDREKEAHIFSRKREVQVSRKRKVARGERGGTGKDTEALTNR